MIFERTCIALLLLIATAAAAGCGAEEMSEADGNKLESATSRITNFCDVVDGSKSVNIATYNKLSQTSSEAVKILMRIYRKYPENAVIAADGEGDERFLHDELERVQKKLSSCDPKEARRLAGVLTATREP